MKIAIATMTWDEKGDAELVIKSLQYLADNNFETYIIDGGSSPKFINKLRAMGHNIRQTSDKNLGSDIKEAIIWAGENADAVLYSEPDKYGWFSKSLSESVRLYEETPVDCLVIGRSEKVFTTFPVFMQKTEQLMNDFIKNKTGFEGDFIYGPKFFSKKLICELERLEKEVGWGTLQYLIARTFSLEMKIDTIFTGTECPVSQQENDSYELRMKQLIDNYKGFNLGL